MRHINKLTLTHHTMGALLSAMLLFTTSCNKYDNQAFNYATERQEKNAKIASRRMSRELLKIKDVITPEGIVQIWEKKLAAGNTTPPKENKELEEAINRLRNANPAEARDLKQEIRILELREFSRRRSEAYLDKEAKKELSKLLKRNAAKIARKQRRSSFWGKIIPSRLFRTKRKAQTSDNEKLILTKEDVKAAWKKIQEEHGVVRSSRRTSLEIQANQPVEEQETSQIQINQRTPRQTQNETTQRSNQSATSSGNIVTCSTKQLLKALRSKSDTQGRKRSDSDKSAGSN